jgi:hypothetical protein
LARKIQVIDRPNKIIHITFIVDRQRIVCYGINDKRRTHPASPHRFKSSHSELKAILEYPIADECKRYHFQNLSEIATKLILINVRIMADGSISNSKPCKSCQKMLSCIPFKKIYYTDEKGNFIEFN